MPRIWVSPRCYGSLYDGLRRNNAVLQIRVRCGFGTQTLRLRAFPQHGVSFQAGFGKFIYYSAPDNPTDPEILIRLLQLPLRITLVLHNILTSPGNLLTGACPEHKSLNPGPKPIEIGFRV